MSRRPRRDRLIAAQRRPVDIRAQFFATHRAGGDPFDLGTTFRRHGPFATDPLGHGRRSDLHRRRELGRAADKVTGTDDWVGTHGMRL